MKDEDIWNLILLGDKKTYSQLFNQLYKPLCNYAVSILKYPEVAEEVVQETFIKVWENRENIQINTSIRAYFFRSVHNNCISFCRGQAAKYKHDKRMLEEIARHAEKVTQGLSENSLESIINSELEELLKETIKGLPDQCRKVFELSRHEQLTYGEIADKLGISVNTVKKQLSRAFAKIRKAYSLFKNN